jgi:hypothetical protein
LPDDLAGMSGEYLAGLSGHHPAGAAVQQGLPHLLLELPQLLGDGRRRVHHQLGGSGDRSLLHYLQEQGKPPDIEQRLILFVKHPFASLCFSFIHCTKPEKPDAARCFAHLRR